MNALTTRSGQPLRTSSGRAETTIELAKMLALVAPTSMTTEQQEMWLRAAVDALDDIRPDEIRHVSAEVRRTVTRHNQIVPEIATLVAERRESSTRATRCVFALPELPPRPKAEPLSRLELDQMKPETKSLGLKYDFLEYRDGKLCEKEITNA